MKKAGRIFLFTVAAMLMLSQLRAMALEDDTAYGTASIVFVEGSSPPAPPPTGGGGAGGGGSGGRDRDIPPAAGDEELVTIVNPKSPMALPSELPKTGGAERGSRRMGVALLLTAAALYQVYPLPHRAGYDIDIEIAIQRKKGENEI